MATPIVAQTPNEIANANPTANNYAANGTQTQGAAPAPVANTTSPSAYTQQTKTDGNGNSYQVSVPNSSSMIVTSGQSRSNYADNVSTMNKALGGSTTITPAGYTVDNKTGNILSLPQGSTKSTGDQSGNNNGGTGTGTNSGSTTGTNAGQDADGNTSGSDNKEGSTSVIDASGKTIDTSKLDPGSASAYSSVISSQNSQVKDAADAIASAKATLANDPAMASALSLVDAQFGILINQMTQKNNQILGGATALAARNGGLQFATEMTNNVLGTVAQQGLDRLSNLQLQETQAKIQITQAYTAQDVAAVKAATDSYNKIISDQQQTVLDLQKSISKQVADNKAAMQKTQDDVNSILKDAVENGASPAVQAAISSAGTVAGAISAAGDSLQKMTGDFANYPQYKKDALASGLVPEDPTTWLAAQKAAASKQKTQEAYGTAFAAAKAKADVDAQTKASTPQISSPVISPDGVTYNVPASVAPYVGFASNGVRYVDLSGFAGTPTEKNDAVNDAYAAGYKVITNKNSALDVVNITDANTKLDLIQKAFSGVTADNAAERNTYKAALTKLQTFLQTNPDAASLDSFSDSALDILKAISGSQGFKSSSSVLEQVKASFPQPTDTAAVANQKIKNIRDQISAREDALVGKPSASDQMLIKGAQQEKDVTAKINSMKTSNPKLAEQATAIFTSIDPQTGKPYTAQDVLTAFPELAQP